MTFIRLAFRKQFNLRELRLRTAWVALCFALAGAMPMSARAADDAEQLRKRVQQLEQQLVDLQVVIGTLETLAGGRPAAPASAVAGGAYAPPTGGGGVDQGRLDSMETQIRALSAQMQNLSRDVRAMGGGRRGSVSPGISDGQSSYASTGTNSRNPTSQQAPAVTGGFGSTTITPADGGLRGTTAPAADAIGGLLSGDPGVGTPASGGWNVGGADQVARAPLPSGEPKSTYETAYGYLLQQDYTSAETAFGDFVKRFPNDKLASNAQYWLGETHFVRGQYKSAAGAFLKGYETYRSGAKAPDSLLKLAMSLEKLGQKDAACSSLSELTVRFPQAPAHVKRKAQSEGRRIRC
ncbi:MAG: tol-pal system protein YbgF [Pseudomonadota bacterium]